MRAGRATVQQRLLIWTDIVAPDRAVIGSSSREAMHIPIRPVFVAAAAAALISAGQSACAPEPEALLIVGETMGTGFSVKLNKCPTPDCLP